MTSRRFRLERFVAALFYLVAAAFLVTQAYEILQAVRGRREVTVERQAAVAIKTLEQNTDALIALLSRLRTEAQSQAQLIEELQAKRTILQLTVEQRHAVEALLYRPQTVSEMLMSRDFWVISVLPNLFFFLLGIVVRPSVGAWISKWLRPAHRP